MKTRASGGESPLTILCTRHFAGRWAVIEDAVVSEGVRVWNRIRDGKDPELRHHGSPPALRGVAVHGAWS